jgi:hypothetical protein
VAGVVVAEQVVLEQVRGLLLLPEPITQLLSGQGELHKLQTTLQEITEAIQLSALLRQPLEVEAVVVLVWLVKPVVLVVVELLLMALVGQEIRQHIRHHKVATEEQRLLFQ